MNATKKAVYLAPQLTAVDVKPERGFAFSNPITMELELLQLDNGVIGADQNSQNCVEFYETGNGWNEGSNHFWD